LTLSTWAQVDHGLEWLAGVTLRQPAHWWALQLEHSKDVVAQGQAVAGLRAQLCGFKGSGVGSGGQVTGFYSAVGLEAYVVAVLAGVMKNPAIFCRWVV
jgi:hypothetical protein